MRKIIMISIALVAPLHAQGEPSFDCSMAESSAEELVCADPELAALDGRLAETYSAALETAESLDAGADAAVATLKAMQRGWIKGRDECWKADDLRSCVQSAYLRREAELVAMWMLEEPYTEAAWVCEDNPANEVMVMYFDTGLPAIRIEYGDRVAAMMQSPTASGSRYDGDFGRFFWEKSGEALFSWEEGVEQSCRLAAG
jgi:uncharacterized protein